VTLVSGQNNITLDAGLYKLASLGDFVWEDSNGNGIQDAGEAGISGVTVNLLSSTGAVVSTTTTNGTGAYGFSGLTPGSYSVQFVAPTGYVYSPKGQGSDNGKDSDADSTGKTASVTLVSGQNNITLDAGLYKPAPGIQIIKDAILPGTQTSVVPNTPVTYTYSVFNTGTQPLTNISVTDDNATPDFSGDDFNPTPVFRTGSTTINVGDVNLDGRLDLDEVWKYIATVIPPITMTVKVTSTSSPIASGTISYKTRSDWRCSSPSPSW